MEPDDYGVDEHCKETYAHFGLAFYIANVFEAGLAIAILQLDFMTNTMERLKREGHASFDQTTYSAEFDVYMASQHALSLGNLIKRALALAEVPPALKVTIAEVKKRRDFLAHHFFRERDVDMMSRDGRNRMIAELIEARELFKEADRELTDFMAPHRSKLGITDELLEAQYAELRRHHGIND